ncbi:MAG TPA: DnaJ domain-containing protein [Myxococcota bacterium]|nr:DnaJ domain-containing protein [Myxococcota bacterium]
MGETDQSLQEIKALARVIDRVDYYRLLKLDPRADSDAVRSAYHDARRRFHPDAFLAQPDDVRDAVDRIARRITEGYLVLRDRTRRAAYDSALSTGQMRYNPELEQEKRTEAEAARGSTPNGKRYFGLHQEAERAGDIVKSHAHLKTALTFEPKNAAFRTKLDALEAQLKAARKKAKNPGV